MTLTPMPPEPSSAAKWWPCSSNYRGARHSDMRAEALYYFDCGQALRERIVELAKHVAHHDGCGAGNVVYVRLAAAEYKCVDGSDCVCGLTDLMDTLKREGLTNE